MANVSKPDNNSEEELQVITSLLSLFLLFLILSEVHIKLSHINGYLPVVNILVLNSLVVSSLHCSSTRKRCQGNIKREF